MALYAGIDLHSNNNYLAIRDHDGKRIFHKKLKNIQNVAEALQDASEDLALSRAVSKESIDFLSQKILQIEQTVEKKLKSNPAYKFLHTVPGIGKILALTITLETGAIQRFQKVGEFTSYCRKAPSKWITNNKKKGKGNTKNGNKYLSWAFAEAVQRARQFDKPAQDYFNKKVSRSNYPVAYAALANKLARASFYIMRDEVPFDHKKLFA